MQVPIVPLQPVPLPASCPPGCSQLLQLAHPCPSAPVPSHRGSTKPVPTTLGSPRAWAHETSGDVGLKRWGPRRCSSPRWQGCSGRPCRLCRCWSQSSSSLAHPGGAGGGRCVSPGPAAGFQPRLPPRDSSPGVGGGGGALAPGPPRDSSPGKGRGTGVVRVSLVLPPGFQLRPNPALSCRFSSWAPLWEMSPGNYLT